MEKSKLHDIVIFIYKSVTAKLPHIYSSIGLKYQHWSKVLCRIPGFKSDALLSPLPLKGIVVGGTLQISCWEVLLACFHGLNFRSQTWALFSITEPSASYYTKVASVEKSCQVHRARSLQKLVFQLGSRVKNIEQQGTSGFYKHIFYTDNVSLF